MFLSRKDGRFYPSCLLINSKFKLIDFQYNLFGYFRLLFIFYLIKYFLYFIINTEYFIIKIFSVMEVKSFIAFSLWTKLGFHFFFNARHLNSILFIVDYTQSVLLFQIAHTEIINDSKEKKIYSFQVFSADRKSVYCPASWNSLLRFAHSEKIQTSESQEMLLKTADLFQEQH